MECCLGMLLDASDLDVPDTWLRLAWLHFTHKVFFGRLQLHEQLYGWSCSRFNKSFGKTASHIVFLKICSQRTPCRMRWSREKPLFLAPSHPKALWEHVFRGLHRWSRFILSRLVENGSKRLLKPLEKPCQTRPKWSWAVLEKLFGKIASPTTSYMNGREKWGRELG